MNAATDRFYLGQFNYRVDGDDALHTAPLYSYESKSTLYDVLVLNGMRYVRVNCGPWSNIISAWKLPHYEIERHFGLTS